MVRLMRAFTVVNEMGRGEVMVLAAAAFASSSAPLSPGTQTRMVSISLLLRRFNINLHPKK